MLHVFAKPQCMHLWSLYIVYAYNIRYPLHDQVTLQPILLKNSQDTHPNPNIHLHRTNLDIQLLNLDIQLTNLLFSSQHILPSSQHIHLPSLGPGIHLTNLDIHLQFKLDIQCRATLFSPRALVTSKPHLNTKANPSSSHTLPSLSKHTLYSSRLAQLWAHQCTTQSFKSFSTLELKCGCSSTPAYCSCAHHIRPSYFRRPLPHSLHCAELHLLLLWHLVVPSLYCTCHFLCPQCEHNLPHLHCTDLSSNSLPNYLNLTSSLGLNQTFNPNL